MRVVDVDPDNLPVGEVVDGWRVVRRLDGGAYGTVYLVEKGGVPFAMKVARSREQSRDERHTHARTERELSCLLSVRHPCIARVWAHGRWPHPTEGFIYFIMDYVEGYTLGEWSERSRITAHELVVLLDKVFAAVAHLHTQGIFHRDLKPGNILVRASTAEPVVVDYGVAHFPVSPEKLTDQRLPPGTPRYTSPEAQHFEATHRRDRAARYEYKVTDELYALGVTLYDVLTDPRPWSHPRPQPLLGFHALPARVVNERVPEALSLLTARLMAARPAQRPESVEAARRDLTELLPLTGEEWKRPLHALALQAPGEAEEGEAPALAVPALEPLPNPPSRRRLRARMTLGAAGLCALLACGVYLALRTSAPRPPEVPSSGEQEAHAASTAATPTTLRVPGAPPVSAPLPGLPAPEPVPSVSLPQKGPTVNARNPSEVAVSSPCSEKKPPPRGTPRWVAWCKCAAIVGTVAATQAGCTAVPFRQSPTAECAPESVAAMRALGVYDDFQPWLTVNVNTPCSTPGAPDCRDWNKCTAEGPVTGRIEKGVGRLVQGTLLSGFLFGAPPPDGWPPTEQTLQFRYTEATLPDGSKHPVCLEWSTHGPRCGPQHLSHPTETPGSWFTEKWHDPLDGTRDSTR